MGSLLNPFLSRVAGAIVTSLVLTSLPTISLQAESILDATPIKGSVKQAANNRQGMTEQAVDRVIRPLMAKYSIPGMAVGVITAGKTDVFNYGVASTETKNPIAQSTLFEIGSISKTFTATLASYAQIGGKLSLSDKTSQYLPSLRGSKFGDVSLLNLGTHTPGGLPLQVPDNVHNSAELLQYLKHWVPSYAPGTYRTYTNPGIGTLGLITAKSLGGDFAYLMEQRVFAPLGIRNCFINIPKAKMVDYAQGYTKEGMPVRMTTGVLSAESYGIRATAADLVRYMKANMKLIPLNEKLQRAITNTHKGYFKAGVMTQDLIWEQYPYPVELKTLLEGNSTEMLLSPTPVMEMIPPQRPREDVWINKTGSTDGFGAYLAFVPAKHLGIVILANKSYPIDARVTAAYGIVTSLLDGEPRSVDTSGSAPPPKTP
jgi:beta-lactamase class C